MGMVAMLVFELDEILAPDFGCLQRIFERLFQLTVGKIKPRVLSLFPNHGNACIIEFLYIHGNNVFCVGNMLNRIEFGISTSQS